jgi:hypothetical protein
VLLDCCCRIADENVRTRLRSARNAATRSARLQGADLEQISAHDPRISGASAERISGGGFRSEGAAGGLHAFFESQV